VHLHDRFEETNILSYMASKKDVATNTLQNTLMNHDTINSVISTYLFWHKSYVQYAPDAPFIIGEGNSISEGGEEGISDTFGAALWAFDYLLLAAARGFQRVTFHQGVTNFYTAFKDSGDTTNPPLTRPVYYGHLAAAAMIGNETGKRQIVPLPTTQTYGAAYASYVDGELRRLAAVNMVLFNKTQTAARGVRTFTFEVGDAEEWTLMRLVGEAANSNAIGVTTFDGKSCEYRATNPGVCIKNTASPENISAVNGILEVKVQDSEAVVMYVHGTVS